MQLPARLGLAAGYLATIVAANWAITRFGLVPVGFGLLAPAGVFFAGLAFTLRDLLHEASGRWAVLAAIKRLRYVATPAPFGAGVDSADGTFLAFGPDRRLPELLGWLRDVHQPALNLPTLRVGSDSPCDPWGGPR